MVSWGWSRDEGGVPRRRSLHRKSRHASNICVGVPARSFSLPLSSWSALFLVAEQRRSRLVCAFSPPLSLSLTRDFRPSSHGSSSTIRPVNSSRRRGTRYNVSRIPGCRCSSFLTCLADGRHGNQCPRKPEHRFAYRSPTNNRRL